MTPDDINNFWLNEVGEKSWYNSTDALDEQMCARFSLIWLQADMLVAEWSGDAYGTLALLILTDQLPRNMFRNDERQFQTDRLARNVAASGIAKGFDIQTSGPERQFFYMPFMHSESLDDQNRAVDLFAGYMPGSNLRHAQLHRDVIRKFGRFPWRNRFFGYKMTPQEQDFMEQGGYGAMVRGALSLAETE